jgi:1,4-alpha-glucan branching enzyme
MKGTVRTARDEEGTVIPDREKGRFGEQDLHLFNEGAHYRVYRKLGAHLTAIDGQEGVAFTVWAPNAEVVSVMGDFNGWNRRSVLRL